MKKLKVKIAIIGTGTSGMVAYRQARKSTDSIALIEAGEYGTTCARVGCMPSKLLMAAAQAAHHVRQAHHFGVNASAPVIDGKAVMERIKSERDRFVGFVKADVEDFNPDHRIQGFAKFLDNNHLQIDDYTVIEAERIIIATGSSPAIAPIFADAMDRVIVNDDVFSWDDLPKSVAVFGPGVIGLEIGQALHRLGVKVEVFGRGGFVGPLSDPEILQYSHDIFSKEFYLNADAHVTKIKRIRGGVMITYDDLDGKHTCREFDYILAATGRRANVKNLGLENTDFPLDDMGQPIFDPETMQIGDFPAFIAGDANNDRPLLHEAADEGHIAGRNAASYPKLTKGKRRSPLGVVFSDPQIVTVGSSYSSLRKEAFITGKVSFESQGRSRVMLKNKGLGHLYADPKTGRFLGAEIIGPAAEHLAHLLAWAHQQNLTVTEMLAMPFYHPVIEEGIRTALQDLKRQLKGN
jgi:dihydrolipoamide dehydrogenase